MAHSIEVGADSRAGGNEKGYGMSKASSLFASTFAGRTLQNAVQDLEANIDVGLLTFLDLNPRGRSPVRHKTILRGWDANESLLLEKSAGRELFIARVGHTCVVRFMRDGAAWAFYTTVTDVTTGRSGYLVRVAWPEECYRVSLRRHERIKVAAPCIVHAPGGSEAHATLLDLSAGGCCFSSSEDIETVAGMTISFMLPDGLVVEEEPIIIRNRRADDTGVFKFGCEFTNVAAGDHSGIGLYVSKALAQQREGAGNYILLVSQTAADAEALHPLCIESDCSISVASSILDACHQIRASRPTIVLINEKQRIASASILCDIIRGAPGYEALPIGIYGGSELDIQPQGNAILWLPSLASPAPLRSFLDALGGEGAVHANTGVSSERPD